MLFEPDDTDWRTLYEKAAERRDFWQHKAMDMEDQLHAAQSEADASICTIQGCGCTRSPHSRSGLCEDHMGGAWEDVRRMHVLMAPDWEASRPSVRMNAVYYVNLQDYVKIGVTSDIKRRMRAFYARPEQLLAIEPGSQHHEKRRHAEFAHLRIGKSELFEFGADLKNHIGEIVDTFGDPRLYL